VTSSLSSGDQRPNVSRKRASRASGMLPTGETFNSLPQIADILSQGTHLQQLTDCASHKMMTYALARDPTTS
jgi:hypothetical protein